MLVQLSDEKLIAERVKLQKTASFLATEAIGRHGIKVQDVLDALYVSQQENGKTWYFSVVTVLDYLPIWDTFNQNDDANIDNEVITVLDQLLLLGLVDVEHLEGEPYYRTTTDARAFINFNKVERNNVSEAGEGGETSSNNCG